MLEKIPSVDGGVHTIDPDLVQRGGWVLDAGCRGFCFSKAMADEFFCNVIALDPAADIEDPKIERVHFWSKGLSHCQGRMVFVEQKDRMSSFLTSEVAFMVRSDIRTIDCCSIISVMRDCGIRFFEVIKLDIEGMEFPILLSWHGPIARQVSVEFHYGDGDLRQRAMLDIVGYMSKWYRLEYFTPQDALFVLR